MLHYSHKGNKLLWILILTTDFVHWRHYTSSFLFNFQVEIRDDVRGILLMLGRYFVKRATFIGPLVFWSQITMEPLMLLRDYPSYLFPVCLKTMQQSWGTLPLLKKLNNHIRLTWSTMWMKYLKGYVNSKPNLICCSCLAQTVILEKTPEQQLLTEFHSFIPIRLCCILSLLNCE